MKTVTFLLPTYPEYPSGGYRVVYEYANELVNMGFQVNVVHPRMLRHDVPRIGIYSKIRKQVKNILKIILTPKITWQWIDSRVGMKYIPELLAEYIPDSDVVIASSWHTAEYAIEYPDSKGKKYYLIQGYETWCGPVDRVNSTWRSSMKKIVIARWLYSKGLELGVAEDEMVHISNGLDLKKFHISNPIENRQRRVTMLFSTAQTKGSLDGLKALTLAKQKNPDLDVVLFGGSARPPLLPLWVTYYQQPDQSYLVNSIYNASSIYLCSSESEGWGLPGAEAMACGCALVSTDCGGVAEYATHGSTALLSPIKDPEVLADNLCLLLNNDMERRRLAEAGHSHIQQFTWELASSKLIETIFQQ